MMMARHCTLALCAFALVSLSLAQAPSAPVTPTVASVRAEIARLKADMTSLWTMAHSLSLLPNGATRPIGQHDTPFHAPHALGSPHVGRNLIINGRPRAVLKFEVGTLWSLYTPTSAAWAQWAGPALSFWGLGCPLAGGPELLSSAHTLSRLPCDPSLLHFRAPLAATQREF